MDAARDTLRVRLAGDSRARDFIIGSLIQGIGAHLETTVKVPNLEENTGDVIADTKRACRDLGLDWEQVAMGIRRIWGDGTPTADIVRRLIG